VNDVLPVPGIVGSITVTGGLKPVVWRPFSSIETMSMGTIKNLRVSEPSGTLLNGISGVTFNERSQTLFLIRNDGFNPGNTYEFSQDGQTRHRTLTNTGCEDTEVIKWVGSDTSNDIFVICEENHEFNEQEQRITLCRVPFTETASWTRTAAGNVSALTAYTGTATNTLGNAGLESLCFDRNRGLIYYTAEFQTTTANNLPATSSTGVGKAVIFARSIAFSGQLAIGPEFELCSIAHIVTKADATSKVDVADMEYDAVTDTILLASHEARKVVRISRSGVVLETADEQDFDIDLFDQLEGVTLSPDASKMWLVGEISNTSNEFAVCSHTGPPLHRDAELLPLGSTLDFGAATSIINDGTIYGHAWRNISEESFNGQVIVRAVQWTPDGAGGYLDAAVLPNESTSGSTPASEVSYWVLEANNLGCVVGVAVHPSFETSAHGFEKGWGHYDGLWFDSSSLALPDYQMTIGRIASVNDKFEFLANYSGLYGVNTARAGVFR